VVQPPERFAAGHGQEAHALPIHQDVARVGGREAAPEPFAHPVRLEPAQALQPLAHGRDAQGQQGLEITVVRWLKTQPVRAHL